MIIKNRPQCSNTGPARISPEEDTPYRLILYLLPGSLASGTYVPVAVFFVPIFTFSLRRRNRITAMRLAYILQEDDTMEKILRCAIYIRVSTWEQAVYGKSLRAQKECLEEYASKHGMKVVGRLRR